MIGKKKTVQSTAKGKAGNTGKVKNGKQGMKHIDMDGPYLSPQPTTSSIVDTMQGNSIVSPWCLEISILGFSLTSYFK